MWHADDMESRGWDWAGLGCSPRRWRIV
jgi:hypothetical protein